MSSPMDVEDTCRDDEATETVGLGCALEFFTEAEETMKMIDNIKNVYSSLVTAEPAFERFLYVLSLYQEQPHLLDPHLDKMLNSLISIVRCEESPMELKHETFKYLHVIMKVRGYKVVVRHLPHEVSDLVPVLSVLEKQDPSDSTTWQTRYVLLLWLSIIVMIPFHMSRLDSFQCDENSTEGKKTVMTRIFEVVKQYIVRNFQVAAFLASRFLTRSDVKELHLLPFLEWSHEIMCKPESGPYARCGVMAAVASILKHGKREDLLPYAPMLLNWISESKYREEHNSLVRKFGVKIVQRIGLTFLKTRVAVWRYQRGCRSLLANLSAGDMSESENCTLRNVSPKYELPSEEEISEDFEVPDEVEEVIEELMQALKDSEIVIRWSAAKGIGRVTGRLPKDLADEVVGSVLEMFNPRESDGAWHGGCLALAELGRRGLLLPERLNDVVPLVLKALVYDEPKGYVSVGSHIRDAACFVCWAFARAYDKEVLRPYVKDLAATLLVVASFDREINCRRAASAAFQENVGRQGTFPHGIEILTAADYFTVGVRTNAFLSVSVYIAQFEEYTQTLIDHLVDRKVGHWDPVIRDLTAKALHNLTSRAPDYMSKVILKTLLEKTQTIDLNVRHGSVIAIGEILHALAILSNEKGGIIQDVVAADVIEDVCQLVPKFRQRLQFRGLGGDSMKQACAYLIEKCSLAVMPFHDREIIADWQLLLDDCLSHETLNVRSKAAGALPAFFSQYYRKSDGKNSWKINTTIRDSVVAKYTDQLSVGNEVTRMGFSLALGCFPEFMLSGQLHIVFPALIKCSKITEPTQKWAESRRDALKALAAVCATVRIDANSKDATTSSMSHLDDLFSCFMTGLMEYTLDSRGDIGAWVREAAMSGLQILTMLALKTDPLLLTPGLVKRIMANVAQQAVERIDRTRAHAGRIFSCLLHSKPAIPNIPHYEELLQIFPADKCESEINWLSAADTFPRFTQMLSFPPYTYNVLLGLIVSVGGLSESLVKHSSVSLFVFLKKLNDDSKELARLCDCVVDIFVKYQFDDRVVVPLLGFLDRLMSSGCIQSVLKDLDSGFASEVLRLVKAVLQKSRDHAKISGGIDVLCQLIQVKGAVGRGALVQLSIFLCHRYLGIRRLTSSRFFESLLVYGDDTVIPEENLDEVMNILSDTDWEKEVDTIKPTRNKLCELMEVPVPKTVTVAKKVSIN